jgi:peptidoglycan hydrolase CwlO-like protein
MGWEKKFTTWVGSRTSVLLHTIFFVVMFVIPFFGVNVDKVLLVLTTVVSLEAIYLSIFIQMTVNQNTESLEEVEEDIEEIQSDVDEIQVDVGEIQEDVDEIEKDTDDIVKVKGSIELEHIHVMLKKLLEEVDRLKNK